MLLLCPSCRTPLPEQPQGSDGIITCSHCSAEIDLTRASTAAGRPRFVPEIDRAGDEVGGRRIGKRIGAGGMGTVYRADGGAPGTGVAVKFLSPALAGEPDLVARFAREVSMLRGLDHEAIVRVVDHGDAGGVPWYAMELVEGTDLKTRLIGGPLSPAEIGAVFGRILAGLAHAHDRGVVHRDLKPGNVLLAASGAKLADFGIARRDEAAGSAATRLTETAAIVGTFPYMSPEQRAGRPVDKRSDLFSVGVMLYEAATGRLPQGAFPPASQVERAYGAAFDRVVARLLHPDPAARFPDARTAARALEAALTPHKRVAAFVVAGAASFVAVIAALLPPALTKLDVGGGSAPVVELGRAPQPAVPPAPGPTPPPAAAPQQQEQADVKPAAQAARQAANGNMQALDPPPVAVRTKGSLLGKIGKVGASGKKAGAKLLKADPRPKPDAQVQLEPLAKGGGGKNRAGKPTQDPERKSGLRDIGGKLENPFDSAQRQAK